MAAKANFVDPEKLKLLLEDQTNTNKQIKKHFKSSETVRDIVLGVSDGLTLPFALAAGLSSANVPSSIIVVAGIAEVVAGAISMGLSGYLAAKSEAELYNSELKRKHQAIIDDLSSVLAGIRKTRSTKRTNKWNNNCYVLHSGRIAPIVAILVFPIAREALTVSIVLTIIALMVFGLGKGYFTGSNPLKSAIQTAFIGAFASAAAYYLAKLVK